MDSKKLEEAAKRVEKYGYKPEKGRPNTSNADEWAVFFEYHDITSQKGSFLAVQIAEAIEDGEQFAVERALSRMGWDEIDAYEREWNNGQQGDDAGGYWIRCISRLFGIKRKLNCAAELGRYKSSCRAMVDFRFVQETVDKIKDKS